MTDGLRGRRALRIVQVSDTHLSRTHGYFYDNWTVFLDALASERPDRLIHTGDVTFNGPISSDDIAFGRAELDRTELSWNAVAGNHDIGEAPAFSRLAQPIDDTRIARWRRHMGELWWSFDFGEWRLVGLDTALMASERPEEREQAAFLREALNTRGRRPVMVFMHMPPFDRDREDDAFTTAAIPYPARGTFLETCAAGGVKVIACGHLHVYRRLRHRGMEIVWAPSTAMMNVEHQLRNRRRFPRPGYLVWEFDGRRVRHSLVEPPLMPVIDVTGWTTRNGGTTTTMPPKPLHGRAGSTARPALTTMD